jgi:hypothetical protein
MIYGCSPYVPIEASIFHWDFSAMRTPNGQAKEIWWTVDSIESLDETHENTYPSTCLGSPANLLLKLWEHKHVESFFFSTDDVPFTSNKKNILHTLW